MALIDVGVVTGRDDTTVWAVSLFGLYFSRSILGVGGMMVPTVAMFNPLLILRLIVHCIYYLDIAAIAARGHDTDRCCIDAARMTTHR